MKRDGPPARRLGEDLDRAAARDEEVFADDLEPRGEGGTLREGRRIVPGTQADAGAEPREGGPQRELFRFERLAITVPPASLQASSDSLVSQPLPLQSLWPAQA